MAETGRIKIDPEVNINDLITEYPELAEVLTWEYGLHCVNCIISEYDTLKQGAAIHGIDDKDLADMIAHLESVVNDEESF